MRAAPASRQPATITRPASPRISAHVAQSAKGRRGCGALPFRYAASALRSRAATRLRASQAAAAFVAQRGEERSVRRLRTVAHHARERVKKDDGASDRKRRPVAPEAEHVSEAQGGRGDRVERLAWQVQSFPVKRHDDRVELTRHGDAAHGRPADEGLGVSNRRGAGQGGDGVHLAGDARRAHAGERQRARGSTAGGTGSAPGRAAPPRSTGSRGAARSRADGRARARARSRERSARAPIRARPRGAIPSRIPARAARRPSRSGSSRPRMRRAARSRRRGGPSRLRRR